MSECAKLALIAPYYIINCWNLYFSWESEAKEWINSPRNEQYTGNVHRSHPTEIDVLTQSYHFQWELQFIMIFFIKQTVKKEIENHRIASTEKKIMTPTIF